MEATTAPQAELEAYITSGFDQAVLAHLPALPLAPEPHVAAWTGYVARAEAVGAARALYEAIIQLQFGIEAGISETEAYRAATRRGEWPASPAPMPFVAPEQLSLTLYDGAAGPIPVVVAGDRQDFVTLVRALSKRNEPTAIPDSMGATMIAGFINWDRVRARRQAWEATPETERAHATWAEAFQAMVPDKPAYQDRLIVLSQGPYSAVPAAELGLAPDAWLATSLALRREHEYTHYFTRRVLGSMRNNMLDELIADAMGMLAATGSFRADWFLRFVGLEGFPAYRAGGRLENYRGNPALSDEAFAGLGAVVVKAARALEAYLGGAGLDGLDPAVRARLVLGLSSLTLADLAAGDGAARLGAALAV